jgi:hypothetical protein
MIRTGVSWRRLEYQREGWSGMKRAKVSGKGLKCQGEGSRVEERLKCLGEAGVSWKGPVCQGEGWSVRVRAGVLRGGLKCHEEG